MTLAGEPLPPVIFSGMTMRILFFGGKRKISLVKFSTAKRPFPRRVV
jgi:hypothetical protein